jgi:hypothetical protein
MPASDRLDPIPEELLPLFAAIGRAVWGAASLEKILLLDVLGRLFERHGLGRELTRAIGELQRQPGGPLLKRLTQLEIPPDLAKRIATAIDQRNWLVHRLMEDVHVASALPTGTGMADVIEQVDLVTVACGLLIEEMQGDAFGRLEALFSGMSAVELMRTLASAEPPDGEESDQIRTAIAMAAAVSEFLESGNFDLGVPGDIAEPSSARRSTTPRKEKRMPNIATGQVWKKSKNEQITVDGNDGTTVTGVLTTLSPFTTAVWVGSPSDFDDFELVDQST